MKALFISALLVIVTFASCKKSEDMPHPQAPPVARGIQYRVSYDGMPDSVQFGHWYTDTSNLQKIDFTSYGYTRVALSFTRKPDNNKLYKIVGYPRADNEVSISGYKGFSFDNPQPQYLNVSLSGGNLRFEADNIELYVPPDWFSAALGFSGRNVYCSFDLTDH